MDAFPRAALTVFAAVFAALIATAALAAPGEPDSTFGTNGQLSTPASATSGNRDRGAFELQPDGKLLVAGTCPSNSVNVGCVARYLANGMPDTSFGNGGTALGGGPDMVNAMILQGDDRIVVAGGCGSAPASFCLARYTANGSLDATFGAGGIVSTVIGLGDYARALALQSDGKLVAAGACLMTRDPDVVAPCFARYNPSGALDTTFGNGGKIHATYASGHWLSAMVLQADGKLVSTGCPGACLMRLNSDGSLDTGFGDNGFTLPVSNFEATAVAVQPDGHIVVGGRCGNYCLTRYQPDGSADGGFGIGGVATISVGTGNSGNLRAIALQADGRIIAAGACRISSGPQLYCLTRQNADGSADTSFQVPGTGMAPVGIPYFVGLQRDGKIVASGPCPANICIARFGGGPFGYQACKPDFDGDGRVTATVDGLILTRVALGMTGNAVTSGITFAGHATRTTWPQLRNYFVTQCSMPLP